MHLASFLSLSGPEHAARRRRILSFVLTIGAHLLLLLMLLKLTPEFVKMAKSGGGKLMTFSVAPDAQEESTKAKSTSQTNRAHAAPPPAATVPPPKIELPVKAAPWVLTPGLEKFDVRQLPQHQATAQPSDASAADEASGDSDSDRPVAYGPGGQPLYAAQWYREPTDTELSYYAKKARPGPGYAVIGCQTVARYHVDNCYEIEESLGSGLGRAMHEAAWQFLVVPPRVGGTMKVGTWVMIRITFSERKEK